MTNKVEMRGGLYLWENGFLDKYQKLELYRSAPTIRQHQRDRPGLRRASRGQERGRNKPHPQETAEEDKREPRVGVGVLFHFLTLPLSKDQQPVSLTSSGPNAQGIRA